MAVWANITLNTLVIIFDNLLFMKRYSLFIIMALFVLVPCGAQVSDGGVSTPSSQAVPDHANDSIEKIGIHHVGERLVKDTFYEKGKATYYSARSHGRRTASGEKHDKNAMICAHKKLPFGTLIRVVNENNKKEVIVRVNDRGPYSRGMVIDLSVGAAKALGMLAAGVVPVSLYVLE